MFRATIPRTVIANATILNSSGELKISKDHNSSYKLFKDWNMIDNRTIYTHITFAANITVNVWYQFIKCFQIMWYNYFACYVVIIIDYFGYKM